MLKILKQKVNLSWFVNPFYLYCIAFTLAILVYLLGWSDLYPKLSLKLILFLVISFIPALLIGFYCQRKDIFFLENAEIPSFPNKALFLIIIILGAIDFLFGGKIPLFNRGLNYQEFGVDVIDPIFNTLCIFFSVFFFHTYLQKKERKLLFFIIIILSFQLLLYRRSTIVWIIISSTFLYLLYKKKMHLNKIILSAIFILMSAYIFGLFGNKRSNLDKSYAVNNLSASSEFKNSEINHNYYMTYLYISSPLANLQLNIDSKERLFEKGDFKSFIFYSLMPMSITFLLKDNLNLLPPNCKLISPDLIVGTIFMTAFSSLGWTGMIIMALYMFVFIGACLLLVRKWNSFMLTTLSILSTTISLLIFSNFLDRLDVIMMLFIYPILFHLIVILLHKKIYLFK